MKTTFKTTPKHRRAIFRRHLPNDGSFVASRNAGRRRLRGLQPNRPLRPGTQTEVVSCCRHLTPYVYTNQSLRTRQQSAVTNYRQLDLTKTDRGCRRSTRSRACHSDKLLNWRQIGPNDPCETSQLSRRLELAALAHRFNQVMFDNCSRELLWFCSVARS